MKLITVYLENGIQLEIQLNYLLIERILINNELVSSKAHFLAECMHLTMKDIFIK